MSHHPELMPSDYALAQDAVVRGQALRQNENSMAYALDEKKGIAAVVKTTKARDELYLTSLIRLSDKEKKRRKELARFARGKV